MEFTNPLIYSIHDYFPDELALGRYCLGKIKEKLGAELNGDKEFQSVVTLEKGGKTASATRLMAIMGMGVKCGDTVNVTVEGADEETAAAAMEEFFKANL